LGILVDHLGKAVLGAVANSSETAQQQAAGEGAGRGDMAEPGKVDGGQQNSGGMQRNGGGNHMCAGVHVVLAMMAALLLLL
jgi:hypothetical protein